MSMLQLSSSNLPTVVVPAVDRIRSEFREMPGLVLTVAQACRLWSLDVSTCTLLLSELIDSGYLCRKADGTFCRATDLSVRPRMAKAGLPFVERELKTGIRD
jgi:hypothetical protein